nr:alanine:cation symporter family protein [uncultured Brevundimonas sp.]
MSPAPWCPSWRSPTSWPAWSCWWSTRRRFPAAFGLIFTHAFTPTAAEGGFAGAAVWAAIRFGVARGIFSNEAGLGSAPIAHAAATTKNPVRQGMIAMLGTFIDTIIVCTITGLAIISSGVWTSGETGAALTSAAFEASIPGIGGYLVTIALAIFAFTTVLGWSFYGEKCVEYLLGVKSITPFRILWIRRRTESARPSTWASSGCWRTP